MNSTRHQVVNDFNLQGRSQGGARGAVAPQSFDNPFLEMLKSG